MNRTLLTYSDLPRDIFSEIRRYLPPSTQARLYRESGKQLEQNFNWDEECCKLPTTSEIAKWLIELRNILINPYPYLHNANRLEWSVLTSWLNEDSEFAFSGTDKKILLININAKNGDITYSYLGGINKDLGWVSIGDIKDIINILRGRSPILAQRYPGIRFDLVFSNWRMIKNVLSNRLSCSKHGIDITNCLKQLAHKHFGSDAKPEHIEHLIRNV